MPDIFLSYNREDQATARRYAEAFQAEGFEVWWDTTLRAGEAYDEVTEAALNEAKAVVVLWSPRSVVSRWVRAEATQADRNKTLVPVTIEACKRPIMFELTQTADLAHWQGEPTDKAWLAFLADVKRFVQSAVSDPVPVPPAAATLAPRQPGKLSICVLPFANMSGDAEQEYFADGISEDIITDLSKVSALAVIARNSAFTFKGKHVDLLQVAKQLRVSHILEGSVRKAGNRVRITAQLIDGATNDHVWAERYDRDLDDIFALQDEISQAIVAALKLKLLPEEKKAIGNRGTNNLEAYDLYIRARALHATLAPGDVARAIEIYRRALALDPEFAMAWAGLGSALAQGLIYFPITEAVHAEIADAIARANALAPNLQEVNVSQAYRSLVRYEWAGAEQCVAAADGGLKDSWGIFSYLMLTLGRAREAAETQSLRRQADPLALGVSFVLQLMLDCAGRPDEAETELERSRDLQGNRVTLEWRAVTRMMTRRDHAGVKRRYVEELPDDGTFMPFRAALIEVLDDPKGALKVLRAAFDDPACQDGGRLSAIAHWAVYYGDRDLALRALRRAFVEMRSIVLIEVWQPLFAELRRDPRFKDILREVGLVDHWRATGNWGDFARPVGDDDFEIIR